MKRLPALIMVIFIFSCSKEGTKPPIVGKWKMVEAYNGTFQGCNCWSQVPSSYADILELTFAGKYKIKKPPIASSIACPGSYRIINDSTIAFTAECGGTNPNQEFIGIYSQATKQLTIEYNYPSLGIIKHRYAKLVP
jgi:hypothetical protein